MKIIVSSIRNDAVVETMVGNAGEEKENKSMKNDDIFDGAGVTENSESTKNVFPEDENSDSLNETEWI